MILLELPFYSPGLHFSCVVCFPQLVQAKLFLLITGTDNAKIWSVQKNIKVHLMASFTTYLEYLEILLMIHAQLDLYLQDLYTEEAAVK